MKVLFLVHGMGVHQPGWADYAIDKLDAVAARYPGTSPLAPLRSQLRIEQLIYDDAFRQQLGVWNDSADALEQFSQQHGVAIPSVLSWLRNASALERNYFWTHVVDVLLYRFFPIIRQKVRVRLMRDIAAVLTPLMAAGDPVEASVLGYSLGTAVAHDALAELATRPLDHSQAFMAGNFRFANILMVANVGRILQTDYPVYGSSVQPITPAIPNGYCGRYFNFRNVYDPIPWPAPFRPTWSERYFKTFDNLDHLHQFNTHALEHYLDHPAVHLRLLAALFGPLVPPGEISQAVRTYGRLPLATRCRAAFDRFTATVATLKQELEQTPEPAQLIQSGAKFLAAAEEAKDACL